MKLSETEKQQRRDHYQANKQKFIDAEYLDAFE